MKRKIRFALFGVAMFFMTPHGTQAQQKATDKNVASVERNVRDNSPTSIVFAQGSDLSSGNADGIFQQYLGYDPALVNMQLASSTKTKQNTVVDRYQQYIKGVKVEFGSYSIMSKNGIAQFMTGNFYNAQNNLIATHKMSEAAALEIALKKIGADTYMWQIQGMERNLKEQKHDPNATFMPKGALVWVEDRSSGESSRELHMAYSFDVYAVKPLSRNTVYVDANNGKVLLVNQVLEHTVATGTPATGASLYSGTVSFQTTLSGEIYTLHDPTRGGGVNTFNLNNSDGSVVSEFTNGGTVWASDAAIDAHWGAKNVYDYWNTVQSRNSFDNAGSTINSYVHYLVNYNNAFWDGTEMMYGDGSGIAAGGFSPLTSQDVCAHEIGHAICQYTAGLVYASESGAMNEGLSDIWGAVIENWSNPHETDAVAKNTWAIGEEIGTVPLRRMDTPSLRGDPDTYHDSHWVNTFGCVPANPNDQCGVHTNSGVMNHWFYFLCQGGAGTNSNGHTYSVTGVGIETGADIVYNSELALSSTADYALFRSTTINTAIALYGACSAEVQAVRNAWYAVGVFSAESSTAGAGIITGASAVCLGTTLTLADAVTGGNWISNNPAVAMVSASGVVTGASTGTAIVYYSVAGTCGRVSTGKVVTVNASPSGISASPVSATICPGANVKLKTTSPGYVPLITQDFNSGLGGWTVDNTGNVSDPADAPWQLRANGFSDEIGTWYSPDSSSFAQANSDIGGGDGVTETRLISPTFSLSGYSGYALTFQQVYNSYSSDINVEVDISTDNGSTWSLLHDYMGTSTGNINGFTSAMVDLSAYAGMSNLKIRYYYKSNYGWYWAVDNVVISGIVPAANLTAWSPVTRLFNNTALTSAYSGSVVDSIYAAPLTTTTYTGTFTNSLGCSTSVTSTITVNPGAAITGSATVCLGSSTTLTTTGTGGTWSSSNTSVATVADGVVTGVATGSALISYVTGLGCIGTKLITVLAAPASISGSSSVCVGTTATLTDATTGGLLWTSTNTSVATIGSISGIVTGNATGTTVITYQLASGCYTTKVLSVVPVPAAISGSSPICVAGSTTFSSTDAGGTWSSSSTVVATVGSTNGVVTGMFAGSAYITYTLSGCRAVRGITVNVTPSPITGATIVCMGSTATLSDVTTGGTWSSDNSSVASVSSAGVVTGAGIGTATISYATSTCARSVVVTVTTGIPAITGVTTLCTGSTSALADATSGGSWSSSNTAVATIGTSGIVTGVSGGTATITYNVSTGCRATTVATVSATLPAITGATAVNIGSTTTFSNATPGGVWMSSNTSIATVNSSTGVVTGVAAGSAMITYGIGSGCFITKNITVNAAASAIIGSLAVCIGGTSTLTDATTGGVSWTSSNSSVATVGTTSGIVTGVSVGTVVITYTVISGAYATAVITINPLPAVITGTASTCVGSPTTLSSASTGGMWSSSNATVATVGSSTGVVTGVAAGAAYIYYTLLGCSRAITATVNPLPAVITGVTLVCNGSTATLSSATTGGAWTSSAPSIATISGGGMVTGVTSGTSLISYTLSATGCARTTTVSVGLVSAITGNLSLCIGFGSTLADASTGGTWSSTNPAIASITSAGLATGVAAGTTTITYALSAGCRTIAIATVSALPATITGTTSVCVNSNITLADVTTGGTWSSSNPALGSISATGVVTGISAGTPTFSYTLGTGCYRAMAIAIKALPGAITGTASVCVGTTGTLSDPTSGGLSWTSTNTAVATIGATSGILTGVTVGTSMITFTLTTGCIATRVATVNAGLSAGTVTGPATMSLAASIASPVLYTDGVSGGTWSTSNTSRATIGAATGLLTGVSAGAVTVTYTVSNSCQTLSAIKTVTITAPRGAGNDLNDAASTVQLYPNPTTGNLTLQAPAAGTLAIYTLEGKEVTKYQVVEGTTTLSLPKNIATGVYMCRYAGDDGSAITIRLVYQTN